MSVRFSTLMVGFCGIFLLAISGCGRKSYQEIESRSGTELTFKNLNVQADVRLGREIGIVVSGVAANLPKSRRPAQIFMQVFDASGKPATRILNTEFEEYGATKMARIGKNDTRSDFQSEYNFSDSIAVEPEFEDVDEEDLSGLDQQDSSDPYRKPGPFETINMPFWDIILPDSQFVADFDFFIPYHEIGPDIGPQNLQVALAVTEASLSPKRILDEFMLDPMHFSAPAPLAYTKIGFSYERPEIIPMRILVEEVSLNSVAFNPSAMDFSLRLGNNERAGFPDIYWGIGLDGWMAWTSPRYRNSLIGAWQAPSDVIWFLKEDVIRICVMDFDFPSADDVVDCWEGSPFKLTGTADSPEILSTDRIKAMKVSVERVKYGEVAPELPL